MLVKVSTFSDVMEHHIVNEIDDDGIESGSTSSLNSDTGSDDFWCLRIKSWS